MIEIEVDDTHRILSFAASGTIHAEDYQTAMPKVFEAIAEWDHFRLLLNWENLEGWAPDAESDRLLATREFRTRLDRVAIIANPELTNEAVYSADIVHCESRVFDPSARDEAWAWLRSGDGGEARAG